MTELPVLNVGKGERQEVSLDGKRVRTPDQRARQDADIIIADPAPVPRVLDEQGHPIPASAQLETRVM